MSHWATAGWCKTQMLSQLPSSPSNLLFSPPSITYCSSGRWNHLPSCPFFRQLFAQMSHWRVIPDLHPYPPHFSYPIESRAGLTGVPEETIAPCHF